jgi:hypothetical protein
VAYALQLLVTTIPVRSKQINDGSRKLPEVRTLLQEFLHFTNALPTMKKIPNTGFPFGLASKCFCSLGISEFEINFHFKFHF